MRPWPDGETEAAPGASWGSLNWWGSATHRGSPAPGMGISTVTAARILKGQLQQRTGEETVLEMDRFPYVALSKVSRAHLSSGWRLLGGGGRESERGRVPSLVPHPFPGNPPPKKLARLQVTHTDPGPEGEAGRAAGTPRLAHVVVSAVHFPKWKTITHTERHLIAKVWFWRTRRKAKSP